MPDETKRGYKRRRVLIDRRFQVPIALTMSFAGLAMLGYHLVVVHLLVESQRAGIAFEPRSPLYLVPLVVVFAAVLGWLAILVSHRIVGPSYRLRRTLEAFAAGATDTRANLRKKDALGDLAGAVNELGEHLEGAARDRAAAVERLRAAIEEGADRERLLALVAELDAGAENRGEDRAAG